MEIMVLGYSQDMRDDLEAQIRSCLGIDSPIALRQYSVYEAHYLVKRPKGPAAVFIIIDGPCTLHYAKKIAGWGENYPMVMVATHPQYAIEGIRQKVRHYILFPLEREEIEEALKRVRVME